MSFLTSLSTKGKEAEKPCDSIVPRRQDSPTTAGDDMNEKPTNSGDEMRREPCDAGNCPSSSNLASPGRAEGSATSESPRRTGNPDSLGPRNSIPVSSKAINSNTVNSNTVNSNTVNSNTANSNTANSNTANSNTANSNTVNSTFRTVASQGVSRGSGIRNDPSNAGNLPNHPVVHRNSTTPRVQEPDTRQSLWSVAPLVGTLILLTSIASSSVLSLFFVLYEAPSSTAIGVLSIFFYLAHTAFLAVFTFHPCIRPEPESPGRTIFFYFFSWFAVQTVGFVCVDFLWERAWPDFMKRLCVAWMLLSLASVGLWTFAIIFIIGRRGGRSSGRSPGKAALRDVEAGRAAGGWRQQEPPAWSPAPIELRGPRGPPPAYSPSRPSCSGARG
ncbi:hypothetical protein CSOJ01_12271 [Colletotrichum sojae]|uniref:Uncharacterized protein n=1 Tax=Colletotrichum sojae TaxID=2175907 RepID=A0A8H6IV97_9PEZI|nr:hypothetical protein CSOJ01_12271 [Colletotrichum sojae]